MNARGARNNSANDSNENQMSTNDPPAPSQVDQAPVAAPGSAAFRVQRTTWEANDAPVELGISVLRGDRCSFEAVLGRPGVVERTPVVAREPT